MCGRYSNHVRALVDWSALLGDWPGDVAESHNISPGQPIAVFTSDGGHGMRWGLIPPWLDEVSGKYATFNARVETLDSKPAFKHAWKRAQRCVVPALGYYEWLNTPQGKQPYFVRSGSGEPLFFAGLYEPARSPGIPASCTVITRPATPAVQSLHPRMPLMMEAGALRHWFHEAIGNPPVLESWPEPPRLDFYPVSRRVNNARNQGSDLISPVDPAVSPRD